MIDVSLFIKNNDGKGKPQLKLLNKRLVYYIEDSIITINSLRKILKCLDVLEEKFNNMKIPICFAFYNYNFQDKMTYILFECICKYILNNKGNKVYVSYQNKRYNILNDGIVYSPLEILRKREYKKEEFNKKFNIDISKNHFRKIIFDYKSLCVCRDDVETFLSCFKINEKYLDEFSEMVGELVDNALTHGNANCLVDIDVGTNYAKINNTEKYIAIKLCVLNFSEILIGDKLKEKLKHKCDYSQYNKVKEAYNYHKEHFSSNYNEIDFYNVASFQKEISGRLDDYQSGGTGLTSLIESLENKSEAHRCYMISGNRGINFIKDYIKFNEQWIGFNKDQNFFSNIPDKNSIIGNNIYIPGTVYNLDFVFKKED